jgi:RecA/RadA recombinase
LTATTLFHLKRLSQIAAGKFDEVAEQNLAGETAGFQRANRRCRQASQIIPNQNFGLIVVDTINSLYGAKVCRVFTGKAKAFSVNRELNRQMAILAQTAKIQKIPVIVTSQVRSMFSDVSAQR